MNASSRARILLIEDEAKTAPAVLNLGQQLFFDPRLTVDSNMSCASCHQPALYGTDALPTGRTDWLPLAKFRPPIWCGPSSRVSGSQGPGLHDRGRLKREMALSPAGAPQILNNS